MSPELLARIDDDLAPRQVVLLRRRLAAPRSRSRPSPCAPAPGGIEPPCAREEEENEYPPPPPLPPLPPCRGRRVLHHDLLHVCQSVPVLSV